jgi:glycosyltransferase involved in cell wall biosynthesis
MTRIAVLAPEPVRPRMAGMGIRALELARALSADFDVRLLVPNDPSEARELAGKVEVGAVRPGELSMAARGVAAAVVSGHAANSWFQEVPAVPTVADLYDPFPVENLHYARLLGEETARHDRATLDLALGRADFFLCASSEQRLFYCGALFARGRIGAANFPDDPSLERLVAVVPFGVPSETARGDRAAGRRAAGLPADGPLVLFGGVYDWYDPELLLDAWPEVLRRIPDARLLFFENPNPETTPQRVFAKAREHARRIDPAGRSVFFSPWLPYAARADLYAASDLAVTISSEGLETELAFRTRLLDAAWGGLPSVSVGGGSLARALEEAGGAFSSAREPSALAGRVADLLSEPDRRARAGEAAARYAASHTWGSVVGPLAAWCRRPRLDPNRLPIVAERKGSLLRRLGLFR